MSGKKIAGLYVRVSTIDQADGTSLESQKGECLKLAKAHGFHVPAEMMFTDVMSGARSDRPGFIAMMEAAKAKKFERLYAWTVDRLGRSLLEDVKAMADLKAAGVVPWAVKEGDLTNKLTSTIYAAMADAERERIRERTLPAKLRKRDAGLWVIGRPPYGYALQPDKSLKVMKAEARIVQRIFRECLSGMGRVMIARRLNRDGVPAPEVREKMPEGGAKKYKRHRFAQMKGASRAGAEWSKRSVSRIVTNTMAHGEKAGRKFQIEPGAIIDRSDFEAAQAAMRGRFRTGKATDSRWLLGGLITCGSCGATYQHHSDGRGAHRYACGARRAGKSCISPSLSVDAAEGEVIRVMRSSLDTFTAESLTDFVSKMHRARSSDVRRELKKKSAERDIADADWKTAQSVMDRALRAGASAQDIPSFVERVTETSRVNKTLSREVATLVDQLHRIDEANALSRSEVEEAARNLQFVLGLRQATYDDDGKPTGAEDLADLEMVVRALVKSCAVQPDRTISVVLHDLAAEPDRLHRLLTDLVAVEADFVMLKRDAANAAALSA